MNHVNVTRNVIVLDPTLKIDEIDMSYKSFIVRFSGKLIKRIIKDKGWTITKALNFLKSKFQYDEYIAKLMKDIIEEEKPEVILNRNPRRWGFKTVLIAGTGHLSPTAN